MSASSWTGRSTAWSSVQVGRRVNARQLLVRRLPLDRLAGEHEQPVGPLGMVARRVQVREHRVRQELDSASSRPASRPRPHSSASAAARSHVGVWSSSGGQRRLAIHRRDVPVEPQRVRLGREAALLERRLEAAVLGEQRGGRLRADSAGARDLVRRIAAQRDEVRYLGRLDAVALAHLCRPDAGQRPAALLRLQHDRPLADELERVAVAARHDRRAAARLLERDPGGEEVVRLVPVRLRGREAHRLDELRRQVELVEQLLVELAPGLVGGQRGVPVGRHGERVPGREHRARRLLLPEPDQQAADPVEQVPAAAVGAPDRLRQRVVVAVRERVAVDDQERSRGGAQWTATLSATRISPKNPFTAPTASAAGQRS